MAFDAGAIEASLSIATARADADLAKIEARVKKLEDTPHQVKVSAVFDNASVSKARKMFADLDNMISRDAAQRLKSSPQGSVLGALNSLFSPHPVTGAPSAQSSAQSGLLGRMVTQQGGGGGTGSPLTGGTGAGGDRGATSSTNVVRNLLTGAQPGNTSTTDQIKQVLTGQGAANQQTTDQIKQMLTGQGATDVNTTDKIKQMLTGTGASDVTTTDKIKQMLTGTAPGNVNTEDLIKRVMTGAAPGDVTTKDVVKEAIDPASKAAVIKDAGDTGDKSGASFSSMFTSHARSLLDTVAGMFGGGGGGGSSGIAGAAAKAGGGAAASFGANLLGGIGPSILGIPLKFAAIVPAIGVALAVLPAIAGLAGVGMGVAMIGGLLVEVVKNSPKLMAQLKGIGTDATKMFTTIAKPIIPALSAAFAQIPPLLKQITPALAGIMKTVAPQIAGVFAGLAPVIKGLIGVMQAAAPAFGPFIKAIEGLVANILPGLQMVIKATVPFISEFAGMMSKLGSNLGGFFAAAAPAIGASMKVLGALLGVIGGLLPVIMKLAGVIAQTLAPVFTTLAGVVKSLMPFLTIIGNVFAQLAGALLGDLVSAFSALASLLTGIAPALAQFAKALGIVFTTLENSGVFAILGNALEALAGPLAKTISALLNGLAPILPPLFTAIGKIAGILAGGLAMAVAAVLPPLTTLATKVLAAIVSVLPTVLSLFTTLAGIFTGAFVAAVTQLAIALSAVVSALPPGLLQAIVLGVIALVTAFKAAAIISVILDALSANPIILIAAACALLVIGITELVTHWTTVWATIKSVASTVGSFLDNLFHNQIVQDILAIWSLGLVPLAEHWSTVWGDIKSTATGFWNWLSQTFGTDLSGFFTKTVPGWWNEFTGFFTSRLVTPVTNAAKGLWNWISGTFGTDIDTFFTRTIPGWFDQFIGFVKSRFVSPFENAISGAWNWVKSNVFDPMDAFITRTIPGWFDTAVGAIKSAWGKLEADVEVPVRFVVNDILNPLGQAFDDITNALGLGKPIPKIAMAAGGRIRHGTTETADDVLVRVSKGETVVSAHDSRTLAPFFAAVGVPGYASGGVPNPGGGGILGFIQTLSGALAGLLGGQTNVGDAITLDEAAKGFAGIVGKGVSGAKGTLGAILSAIPKKVVSDFMSWLTSHADAGGGEIVAYAQKFIGKIPYVWGGTDLGPAGADCSGFIQALYEHFGISPPRTSEAQGAWVKRTGPQPGGLAFYSSPAGGPPPGHVALVSGANQVISQGGGMGPQVNPLNFMPLLWTGIPPGGFGSSGGGGTTQGGMSAGAIEALWTQLGGPASAAANMARIAFAESGDDPSIIQQGQPPGLTGYGLYQITPTSGISQNGMFGNLLNASNNTRAAIFLYNSSGYAPWSSDPVGGSLVGSGLSYAAGGMITEPVIGYGTQTGQRYSIGERGPELVTPGGGASIADVVARLERLINVTAAVPAGVGQHVGGAIGGASAAASFRSRYPRGGSLCQMSPHVTPVMAWLSPPELMPNSRARSTCFSPAA